MAALGDDLRRVATEVNGLPKAMMLAAVKSTKRIAAREATRDVGSDLRVSGLGRNGTKLILRDDLKAGSGQAEVTLTGAGSAGAWSLVSFGADPHVIGGTRAGRGRSRRGARGRARLVIGGNVRMGPVRHPGTRGKGTWGRVVAGVDREVASEVERLVAETISRHL